MDVELDQHPVTGTPADAPSPFGPSSIDTLTCGALGAWSRRRDLAGAPPVLLLAALVATWQIYVDVKDVRPTFLPSPSRVVREGWRFHDIIWGHTKVTMKETAAGFTVSVAIATLFAVVMDFWQGVRRALYPLLVASQTIPIVVLAPLMIIWFGFDLKPKIILVVLTRSSR